jgi:hypothetical protein
MCSIQKALYEDKITHNLVVIYNLKDVAGASGRASE